MLSLRGTLGRALIILATDLKLNYEDASSIIIRSSEKHLNNDNKNIKCRKGKTSASNWVYHNLRGFISKGDEDTASKMVWV